MNVTIPNLMRQTRISVSNFFKYLLTTKVERKQLMSRSRQVTIRTHQATLTGASRVTQQLQTAGKRRLRINPRAYRHPRSLPDPFVPRKETDSGITEDMTDPMQQKTVSSMNHLKFKQTVLGHVFIPL